jgi:hypothetical protein
LETSKPGFIDLLKKAQNYSLDDQRGPINSQNLEIPEFLLTTHNLIKSHSIGQNLINLNDSINYDDSLVKYKKNSKISYYDKNPQKYSNSFLNKSTVSLPISASLSTTTTTTRCFPTNNNYSFFKSSTVSRSRSPIVIVYDHDEEEDNNYSLDKTTEDEQQHVRSPVNNYESISESNTPCKLNSNSILKRAVAANQMPSPSKSFNTPMSVDHNNSKVSYV